MMYKAKHARQGDVNWKVAIPATLVWGAVWFVMGVLWLGGSIG